MLLSQGACPPLTCSHFSSSAWKSVQPNVLRFCFSYAAIAIEHGMAKGRDG